MTNIVTYTSVLALMLTLTIVYVYERARSEFILFQSQIVDTYYYYYYLLLYEMLNACDRYSNFTNTI